MKAHTQIPTHRNYKISSDLIILTGPMLDQERAIRHNKNIEKYVLILNPKPRKDYQNIYIPNVCQDRLRDRTNYRPYVGMSN